MFICNDLSEFSKKYMIIKVPGFHFLNNLVNIMKGLPFSRINLTNHEFIQFWKYFLFLRFGTDANNSCLKLKLVSIELNHIGSIAFLFQQIRDYSKQIFGLYFKTKDIFLIEKIYWFVETCSNLLTFFSK